MKKTSQLRSAVTVTLRTSSLRAANRALSRSSWAKALTMRIPVIDSFRCVENLDHFTDQRRQQLSSRPQIIRPPTTMNGIGIRT